MGGLDARYAISRLGVASRVAELVTVASPHHGTPLADLGSALLSRMFLVGGLLERVGLDPAAFHDLTTAQMKRFNDEVSDVPGVRYASIVARAVTPMHPLLVPGFAYLDSRAGANDGLVPTSSQRWGDVLAEVDADHFGIIGWSAQFDAAELYIEILRGLGLALPVSAPSGRRAKQRLLSAS